MHMTSDERNAVFMDALLRNYGHSEELRTHLLEVIYRPVFMKYIAPKMPSQPITGTTRLFVFA